MPAAAATTSKRVATRSTATQAKAAAATQDRFGKGAGRASRAERQRDRVREAAPSRSRSRSPVGGDDGDGEEQTPPLPQAPRKRLGRPPGSGKKNSTSARTSGPAPAAAANAAATGTSSPKHDFRTRRTEASLPRMEAAARAAAAAAAAAAVATERTVAVASPALRPWFCSTPFRVADFFKAGKEALEEIDKLLSANPAPAAPPLAVAALLSEAAAAPTTTTTTSTMTTNLSSVMSSPPPAAPATPQGASACSASTPKELPPLVPAGRAIALGPGGGRLLVPGRDVLVTLSLSEAGKPERPLRELVLLATPTRPGGGGGGGEGGEGGRGDGSEPSPSPSQTLLDARDAFRSACAADDAAEELGVSVAGGYCAVEGVIHTDNRAASSSPSCPPDPPALPVDYASPILEFLAATGVCGPLPPREGEGAEARAAELGRGRRGRARGRAATSTSAAAAAPPRHPPWRAGDLSTALLSDLTLRLGGGSGYVFCHQGGCEHALSVRDVRLAASADASDAFNAVSSPGGETAEEEGERHPLTTGDFPLVIFKARPPKARSCQSCGSRRATKATWRDAAAPTDPAFWCSSCYADAHYDDSGSLLVPDHRVVGYRGG